MTVLKDVFDIEFTEGDRVAVSTSRGIRAGKVLGTNGYTVSIDMAEHQEGIRVARVYVKRHSYIYSQKNFLKLPPLT